MLSQQELPASPLDQIVQDMNKALFLQRVIYSCMWEGFMMQKIPCEYSPYVK